MVVENEAQGPGLVAEHGLALWIECNERCLLFDTGQGVALPKNARALGVPLERAEAVVLSHGHYDHTGGLNAVLQAAGQAEVYAHPASVHPKYAWKRGCAGHDIGMPAPVRAAVGELGDRLHETERPTEIRAGLFATGQIPRRTEYEDTGGPFFLDPEGQRPDPLVDDQAMYFDTRWGTVILLGCAHSGIINTLRYVRELTDDRSIKAVIGGTHLVGASRERVRRTIEDLEQLNVERLFPAHCTGQGAVERLQSAFPDKVFACPVGTKMEFAIT